MWKVLIFTQRTSFSGQVIFLRILVYELTTASRSINKLTETAQPFVFNEIIYLEQVILSTPMRRGVAANEPSQFTKGLMLYLFSFAW